MALLLLVQLDGHVACVSLTTGALRWRAALPNGPLSHCERRHHTISEKRLWSNRGAATHCENCKGLCGSGGDSIAAHVAPGGVDCGDGGWFVAHGAGRWEWRSAAGTSVEGAVRRWNAQACPAHRAVNLRRVEASLTEMDIRTGRVLSSLSPQAGDREREDREDGEDKEREEDISPLRLVVRRTDEVQSVLLPVSEGSWYATFATVELDVLQVPLNKDAVKEIHDASEGELSTPEDIWTSEMVQTILHNGAAEVHLRTDAGNVTLPITEPAVRAFVVIPPGPFSMVNFHEIPIRSVGAACTTQKALLTPMDVPLNGGLVTSEKKRISGVFHSKRRVLFVDSSPPVPLSKLCNKEVGGCISEAMGSDGERDEEKSGLFDEDEGEKGNYVNFPSRPRSAPAPKDICTTVLVSHRQNTDDTRKSKDALMTTRVGSSFFDENFEVISLLGRGSSGAVVLVRHYITGVFYAIKIILTRDYFSEEAALKEVRLHAVLRNPYLVRYYACWSEAVTPRRVQQLASVGLCSASEARQMRSAFNQDPLDFTSTTSGWSRHLTLALPSGEGGYLEGHDDNQSDDSFLDDEDRLSSSSSSSESESTSRALHSARVVFLQLEYCQTTLAHRLGSRRCIDRVENIIIAMDLFRGLRYLHDSGCLHRDVKPTNVFLDYRLQLSGTEDPAVVDDDDDDDDDDENIHSKENWASAMQLQTNGRSHISEVRSSDAVASMVRPSTGTTFDLLRMNPRFSSLIDELHKNDSTTLTTKLRKEVHSLQKWLRRHYVQVRLGDFGLSKLVSEQHLDLAGYFNRNAMNTIGVGSPLYSSPEQLEGNVCTPSSDAFAGGILFAEMYLQPNTVAERLVELRRVREGFFFEAELLEAYPELRVVQGLTRKDPNSRMSLAAATRVLSDVLDDILSSFILLRAGE